MELSRRHCPLSEVSRRFLDPVPKCLVRVWSVLGPKCPVTGEASPAHDAVYCQVGLSSSCSAAPLRARWTDRLPNDIVLVGLLISGDKLSREAIVERATVRVAASVNTTYRSHRPRYYIGPSAAFLCRLPQLVGGVLWWWYCNATVIKCVVTQVFNQKQQRVAVAPGNAHCMSIRRVSLRAALAGSVLWPAAAAAPAATAVLLLLL